jgi:guanyl-specific ribonuclease Sa
MKYLFTAQFSGETYEQTAEDVSKTEPTRSAYFDIKDKPIEAFSLHGEGHQYLVDLKDGHFEIDGVPFVVEKVPPDATLRLIYYRNNTVHFSGTEETGREVEFVIGWQYTGKKKKNHQQTISII